MKLYNSAKATLEEFTPLEQGKVSLYYCGPTVQSGPHIGHLMSAVVFDQLIRWFKYSEYQVTSVRNVTDIDDKILAKATSDDPWWQLAYRNEQLFNEAYRALNVEDVSYVPHATAHIPEMIVLMQQLMDAGFAYATGGNVFFDVKAWKNYGSLTRQNIENLESSEQDVQGKKDALDFALWKAAKDNEPHDASWETPWGRGRPGWHLECSAMATKYLGQHFDIHGGGLDLRFPHHENENAQSQAAGFPYAKTWMHHGMVNVKGQKMSKSIGNVLGPDELFAQVKPAVVRYFLSTAHYRSTLDFSFEALEECETALSRIEHFVHRAQPAEGSVEIPDAFSDAMNTDLSVPQALAVVHETVKAGNSALNSSDTAKAAELAQQVVTMMNILGISLEGQGHDDSSSNALAQVVPYILKQRAQAREEKNWSQADELRDVLQAAGIVVEDGAHGASWRVEKN